MINSKHARTSKEDRNEKVAEMLKYHQGTFKALGIEKPLFYPKPAFTWKDEKYISLYERELVSKTGFYTEICDDDYTPLPERKLMVWRGNDHSVDDYYRNDRGVGVRWYIPVDELEEVRTAVVQMDLPDLAVSDEPEDQDAPISKLTIRDFAAILWQKPVADKKWLNSLIEQQKK